MSTGEEDKNKGTDFSDYARNRPGEPPPERLHADTAGSGSRFLRGCGIAVGIAAFVFLFVVGACFVALS